MNTPQVYMCSLSAVPFHLCTFAEQKGREGKAELEEKEKFLISFLIQNKERPMREGSSTGYIPRAGRKVRQSPGGFRHSFPGQEPTQLV